MEYFHKDLLKSCDVLLSLDDNNGGYLPAHSQVLARCSPVFRGMVNEGILASASTSERVIVPFSDCTREEAISFLSIVYSLRPHEHVVEASALSVARLGDKYGVKDVVATCDDLLSKLAGIDEEPEVVPKYLKGKSIDEFMHILDCAITFGMPKLLACCECHIAVDQDRFKPVPSTLLPFNSVLRIAKGLCGSKRKMSAEDYDQRCGCPCCQNARHSGHWDCKCYRQAIPDEDRFMPHPKELLDMAQCR